MTSLDFMQQLVDQDVHEIDGNNRSPVIDEINRELGLPIGSPYCAATVSHCFRKAAAGNRAACVPFPYSGGSQALKHAFAALGRLSDDPNDLLSWCGALGGWTDSNDPAHGHVFFVKGRSTDDSGNVVGLITLEANTSPQTQDRDGEGMYELHRTIASLNARHPDYWFLKTDGVCGGEWWNASL